MAGNTAFDELLSTTLKNYIPKLTDNIFSARPLFYALTNGQTIRRISGGQAIVVPVIYGTNSTIRPEHGVHVLNHRFLRLEDLAFQQVNNLGFAVILGFLNTADRHGSRILLPIVLSG